MMKMKIRAFQPRDEESVVQLWTDCGLVVPWNDPHRDIQRKLQVQPDMFPVLKRSLRLYCAVAILLAVAAVYEALEVIFIMPLLR